MGLFDKKYCDICGGKIGLLGNRKLEDGNCCKECAGKLSPFFDERRHSTVSQIKEQLAYREANQAAVAAFNVTRQFGDDWKKIYLDENAKKFIVTKAAPKKFAEVNPDVIDFSAVTSCELYIDEDEREIFDQDDEGNDVSRDPREFEYFYDFYMDISVNHPFFDEIPRFKLNNFEVGTGKRSMLDCTATGSILVGGILGALSGKGVGGFADLITNPEYDKYVKMGKELRSVILGIPMNADEDDDDDSEYTTEETVVETAQEAAPAEAAPAATPAFCSSCGAKLAPGAKFCESCGAKIG